MKIRHSEGLHKAHFIYLRIYFGLFSSIHLFYSVKQMKTVTHTGDCKRLWTGANSRLSATPESYSPGCCSLGATSRPQPRPTDPESGVQEALFLTSFQVTCAHSSWIQELGVLPAATKEETVRISAIWSSPPHALHVHMCTQMHGGRMQSGRSYTSHWGFWPHLCPDLPTWGSRSLKLCQIGHRKP